MSDINVYITSDLTSSERKISLDWPVSHFKQRMELITGIAPEYQSIHHYAISNSNEYTLLEDKPRVSDWNLAPFCRLHIVDESPNALAQELNEGTAETYQMTEEEYAKRSGTVLQWKAQNKLGRFNPEYEAEKARKAEEEAAAARGIEVGRRCRVINIGGERRGVVRYVGKIQQLDDGEGIWVGLEFDEPVGKNDGSIGAIRVFQCRPKHGSFVRPAKVEVGDFPEIDEFEDEL